MPIQESLYDEQHIHCTVCNEIIDANRCMPCRCHYHTHCFIKQVLHRETCARCGSVYGKITVTFPEMMHLFEYFAIPMLSGILFLIPVMLCNSGNIVDAFNIIIWFAIRAPIQLYCKFWTQMVSHFICLILPTILGTVMYPDLNYRERYLHGVNTITMPLFIILLNLTYVVLWLVSNMVVILIVYIEIGNYTTIMRKIINRIV